MDSTDWMFSEIVPNLSSNAVENLRSIVLVEADFNFNNKILGKQTIEHAESKNLIAKEQYGSRSGKCAVDHALNKTLTYDIIRQHNLPAVLCSNDAKSCYDRVIHSIAAMAYKFSIGQPFVYPNNSLNYAENFLN